MRTTFIQLLLMFGLVLTSFGQNAVSTTSSITGKILPSDTVSITVFREPDLTTNGQLAKDGTLTMPLIKSVKLVGLTTATAESAIEAKLRDGYLVRPAVTVRVTQRKAQTITVRGEVTQPGTFNLPHDAPLTLTQAVSQAGGANDVANIKKVTIRSAITGKIQKVNMKDIIAGKKKDVILKKGDIIQVPEGWF